jgi:hypothetical protein
VGGGVARLSSLAEHVATRRTKLLDSRTRGRYDPNMTELPTSLDELTALLDPPDTANAGRALDAIIASRSRNAPLVLAEFLRTAPAGLLATRAAMTLEKKKNKSTLPVLYEVYEARPELAEDIIPIFSEMEDVDAVMLIVPQLRDLMRSPARLSALAYLVKCADGEALAELLLPMMFLDPFEPAHDDLLWALQHVMEELEDAGLKAIGIVAKEVGPEAFALIKQYMPAESELERQAPSIARALVEELEKKELIELVPDSQNALVELLSSTILEARSPKGLIKDVERILLNSAATEELYADRDDLRRAFETITGNAS